MRSHVMVYIAASLDGYIARADGSIDWLDIAGPDEAERSMADFVELLRRVDCLVMGRKTFETVQQFSPWPYGALPVVVLSTTLSEAPSIEGADVRIRSAPPAELLRDLAREGLTRIYLDGGATIHGFMREDLIDHLTVATVPILLGAGRPLFPAPGRELTLSLERSDVLPSGIVKSVYRRPRDRD
jgi:dihydrofolate reductase